MTEKVEPVSESKEEKKKKPRTERSGKRKANANSEQQNRIIVRRLPPTMTDEEFKTQVSPLPDYVDYYFAPVDFSLGAMATTRAYLTFKSLEDVFVFKEKFDGYVFVDQKGNEYPAIVEFAPFQGLNRSRAKKRDLKVNTIEEDPHYISFLESLKDVEENKTEGKLEYSYQVKEEVEITSTPLLEFLANKKREKVAERKKKQDDRKKKREEERQRKKQQILKNTSETIKEEKVEKVEKVESKTDKPTATTKEQNGDDDGIIVRVVPSRLDKKQREKAKEAERQLKKEKERERNRERKEMREKERQERKEREKDKNKDVKPQKNQGEGANSNSKEQSKNNRQSEPKKPKDKPASATKPIDNEKLAVPSTSSNVKKEEAQWAESSMKQGSGRKEIKKYSERRKEIRERAEQRRMNTEVIEIDNSPPSENIDTINQGIKSLAIDPQPSESLSFDPAIITSVTTLNVAAKEFTPWVTRAVSTDDDVKNFTPWTNKENKDAQEKESESSDASKARDKDAERRREERRIRNKDRPALEIYKPRRVRLAANFSDSDNKQSLEQKDLGQEDKIKSDDEKPYEKKQFKEPKPKEDRRKDRPKKEERGDRRSRIKKSKSTEIEQMENSSQEKEMETMNSKSSGAAEIKQTLDVMDQSVPVPNAEENEVN